MKKFNLILFLIGTICVSHAQNWQLINPEYTYHYSTNGNEITNVIQVDSITDSIYHLNPIADTIDSTAPQFLGHSLELKSTGEYVTYDSVTSSVFKVNKSVGYSWQFRDSLQATISFELYENVLGQMDFVKIITLSNGLTMRLSKNYGLLNYPDFIGGTYELMGIKELNLGKFTIDFWSIFDLAAGDIFQYEIVEGSKYQEQRQETRTYWKFKVLQKNLDSAGFWYKIHSWKRIEHRSSEVLFEWENESFSFQEDNEDTLIFKAVDYPQACSYPGQRMVVTPFNEPFPSGMGVAIHTDSTIQLNDENMFSDILNRSFKLNAGIEEEFLYDTDYSKHKKLIGYNSNNQIQGVVYSDAFYNGVEDLNTVKINIFPNPVKDQLQIQYDLKYPANVEIYKVQGNLIMSEQVQNGSVLNIEYLNPGLYFYKLFVQGKTATGKFVKLP